MAFSYTGLGRMSTPLSVLMNKPLDTRTVVDATKDLYEVPVDQAYRGMTISNLEDGNIYMLIDENKITKSEGWKSSQSALQIVSCTPEEYKEWAANTDENFEPIDKSKNYLLLSVYYYVYEAEGEQYYLSSDWGKDIEDRLNKTASYDALNEVLKKTNELAAKLAEEYTTSEVIVETYATIALLNSIINLEDPESPLSKALAQYYTSALVDEKFVTKASLGGDLGDLGDGENLVFVTSKQYAEDQKNIQEELAKTLKLDGEGSLDSIVINQIKSPELEGKQLVLEVTPNGLLIEGDLVATESDIPILINLSSVEYNDLVEQNKINPDAYYCIYDEEDNKLVYVTLKDLESTYSTTTLTQFWVALNYYTMSQIDEKLLKLQLEGNEATAELIKNYYDKTESDAKYLTIENAEANLATKDEVSALETKVSEEYVTITMLKGENTDDTDFMFVTQNQYSDDKEAASNKINTKEIETGKATVSEVIILKLEEKVVQLEGEDEGSNESIIEQNITSTSTLTSENNRLMSGGKQVALTEEIPQMVCLPADEYKTLVENDEVKEDVYYYTYNKEENPDDGYVTHAYVTSTFQTITKANQELHNTKVELELKIAALELEIQSLRNLIMGSVEGLVLSIGIADNIEDKTLIVNSGKVENKTLILT